MYFKNTYLYLVLGVLMGFVTIPVNASALSFSNIFIDTSSLFSSSNPSFNSPELETYLFLDSDAGVIDEFGNGGEAFFSFIDGGVTSASAGNEADFVYGVSTVSESSDLSRMAFSNAELSILLPFQNDQPQDYLFEVDYGVFGSIETDSSRDYAAFSYSLIASLLDEDFFQIGGSDEIEGFEELFGSDLKDVEEFGQLAFDVSNLDQGDYYLSFDLASVSITETTQDVPEPGTLLLVLLGVFYLWRLKANENYVALRSTENKIKYV